MQVSPILEPTGGIVDSNLRCSNLPSSGQSSSGSSSIRIAAMACLVGLIGCAGPQTLRDETVGVAKDISKGPAERPQIALTNFSDGLRCLDNLLLDFGVRNLSIIVEDLDDQTKKVAAGTKDMLISAISSASRRSRSIRLVAFGNDARNTASFMDRAERKSQYQSVPDFGIRGSVSQFDDNVAKRTNDAGFSIGSILSIGTGSSATAKVLGLDLAMVRTEDFSVVHGVTSKNAVVLVQQGTGVDASASITKYGLTYQTNTSMSEGTAVALRNLIELASIELIGKLAKVPYWKCLGARDDSPDVKSEMADWLEGMVQSERSYEGLSQPFRSWELFAFFQTQMAALGIYDGRTDGLPTSEFGSAIVDYRRLLGLSPTKDMNQEFLERHLMADRSQLRTKVQQFLASRPTPQPQQVAAAPAAPIQAAPQQSPQPTQQAALRPQSGTAGTSAGANAMGLAFNAGDGKKFPPGATVDLRLYSQAPAVVYCFLKDESGAVVRLLPNSGARLSRVAPGQDLLLRGQDQKAKWEIVANEKGIPETVACFGSPQNLTGRLPKFLQGADFEAIPGVSALEEIRDAIRQASGQQFGEAWFTIRSR
jgi:hypothetical protein